MLDFFKYKCYNALRKVKKVRYPPSSPDSKKLVQVNRESII